MNQMVRISPATSQITLRKGLPTDAGPAGAICFEGFKKIAEQHGFPPDFPSVAIATELMQSLLPRPDIYAVVAEIDQRVVGSNFLWKGDPVAGVGPITVDPSVQNGSIGRRLMQAVLDHACEQGISAVRLVQAAYHSRSLSLYTKLGFIAREPLAVLQGPALEAHLDDYVVRRAAEADIDAASSLSQRIHGYSRASELRSAIGQGTATIVARDGRITGYATSIGFFGHAVGETPDDLKALIAAAPSFAGPGFLLPVRNTDVFRWCLEHGLRVVQPMTLMSIGPYQEPRGAFLPSILY